MSGILDRLPATVRHGILVFIGSFATVVLGAIASAHGVTGIDWASVLIDAVNAGVVAALAAVGLAAGTSLTTQYGVGSAAPAPDSAVDSGAE